MREESMSTLVHLLHTGVSRSPEKIGLSDGVDKVSYRDLESATLRIAARLAAQGVKRGDRVAIFARKECALVAGILGAVKAGAVYVPLDPAAPWERVRFILEETSPSAIIVAAGQEENYRSAVGPAVAIDTLEAITGLLRDVAKGAPIEAAGGHLLPEVKPHDGICILYTSGSTGRPKGVLLEHDSVIAFLRAHNERMGITSEARCMNTSPFHFDVSIMDTFIPLSVGAYVRLTRGLPVRSTLLDIVEQEKITHFCAVCSVLTLMTGDGSALAGRDFSALRLVHTGGEVCDVDVINAWLRVREGTRVINGYGPTETTVVCVSHTIEKPEARAIPYPIGVAHTGTLLRLVDAEMQPIEAPNVQGELLIGGVQLMREYWQRPDETRQRIVVLDGERYYRTGDICYQDEQGRYLFSGRQDDEVKIQGYRIHLNEVLYALLGLSGVDNGVVGVVETDKAPGKKALAAAVSVNTQRDRELPERLKGMLRAVIPAYMIPRYWLFAEDALPMLPSGKVDRRTLVSLLQDAVNQLEGPYFLLGKAEGTVGLYTAPSTGVAAKPK
jgi:D-alanine--poly(phosphoribitol) ligase subunit 1